MESWKEKFEKKDRQDHFLLYTGLTLKEIQGVQNKWLEYEMTTSPDKSKIYNDTIISVKACDEQTVDHLYRYVYNPVLIGIHCPVGVKFTIDDKGELLYHMIVRLESIDDSSYTIWFDQIPLKRLRYIRTQIQAYLDKLEFINGEKLLDYCATLGANPESKSYD